MQTLSDRNVSKISLTNPSHINGSQSLSRAWFDLRRVNPDCARDLLERTARLRNPTPYDQQPSCEKRAWKTTLINLVRAMSMSAKYVELHVEVPVHVQGSSVGAVGYVFLSVRRYA